MNNNKTFAKVSNIIQTIDYWVKKIRSSFSNCKLLKTKVRKKMKSDYLKLLFQQLSSCTRFFYSQSFSYFMITLSSTLW